LKEALYVQPRVRRTEFRHVILEGSHYEIGRQKADLIRHNKELVRCMSSGRFKMTEEEFKESHKLIECSCPGLNEEIMGMADELHISPRDVTFYNASYLKRCHCSQLYVSPSQTLNNHVLVGRNYDFTDKCDDLMLCTVKSTGCYAFIGFSVMLFGYQEGINEHGLTITMTAGGIPVGAGVPPRPPLQTGVQFWVLIRTLLERCATVEEAIELSQDISLCGNTIFLIADEEGNAAIIEYYGAQKHVTHVVKDDASPFLGLFSTNHYISSEMAKCDDKIMENSLVRFNIIKNFFERRKEGIGYSDIENLLSTPYPEGLCLHFYDEYLGTLRSVIYDATEKGLFVSFGSPVKNPRYHINFNSLPRLYEVSIPLEKADSDFWKFI
jgi:predicted choloylglycine hydrolase